MPRTIQATLPKERTDTAVMAVRDIAGVTGVQVHRGASVQPPGDLVVVQATNNASRQVLEKLCDFGAAGENGSIQTTEPRSLISSDYQNGLERESNETIWEEMAFLLRRDTNLSANYLLLMLFSGMIAAAGLWTDTVHIVIGAMVLAPGFEPILRIPFGMIAGPRVLASRGLLSTLAGYLVLAAGAALALLVLVAIDPGRSAALESRYWIRYWSDVPATAVAVALVAGAAGGVVVVAQRPVMSAGVMIALALIPSMAIAGMALIAGNPGLAWQGLGRWAVEAACVIASGAVVIGAKQLLTHRRHAIG